MSGAVSKVLLERESRFSDFPDRSEGFFERLGIGFRGLASATEGGDGFVDGASHAGDPAGGFPLQRLRVDFSFSRDYEIRPGNLGSQVESASDEVEAGLEGGAEKDATPESKSPGGTCTGSPGGSGSFLAEKPAEVGESFLVS